MTKSTRSKITALRRVMREHEIDAYLVPTTDAHHNEYVPACWQRRAWVSGFTGSAGELLVTRNQAVLWTDGRYFLQAEQQLEGSGIQLFKEGEPGVRGVEEHLRHTMKNGSKVGVDPRVISMDKAEKLKTELAEAGATLTFIERNLVDEIWDDAPDMPTGPIEYLPRQRSGVTTKDKLVMIRAALAERNADALIITELDAIAWTFNIRGTDVAYNPVVIAYAIVFPDDAMLFIDEEKVVGDHQRRLSKDVQIRPYASIKAELSALAKRKARVWLDRDTTNQWVGKQLARCELISIQSPIAERKAKKNPTEIQGMRNAHIADGVAMVRFLRWLSDQGSKGTVTEISAQEHLEELRAQNENYRGPSFHPIFAFGPHAAIVHYSATEESNAKINAGILLMDTGGQYVDGTTDITRTVLIGSKPTPDQCRAFTLVLKGHIAVAQAKFPTGVRGMRLDTLARMHLWNDGKEYAHGTGHGVGAGLSVHEGPQAMSPTRCRGAFLEPGNIMSNEPGFYAAGKFGIRLENLVLVIKDDKLSTKEKTWLTFETLTLCPIDRTLIDASLLTADEQKWLNEYHERVNTTLSPLLEDAADREWLVSACAPL
ncbi:MAG: aminopeptidase P family protein [Polyangiaceae bacterium]|nr:aminopeptidase P family protein [Polyangiaceae bacterium]